MISSIFLFISAIIIFDLNRTIFPTVDAESLITQYISKIFMASSILRASVSASTKYLGKITIMIENALSINKLTILSNKYTVLFFGAVLK